MNLMNRLNRLQRTRRPQAGVTAETASVAFAMDCEPLESRCLLSIAPYAALTNLDDANKAYSSITGKGQTVAVIDTGVDYKLDVLGGAIGTGHKVVAGYDFYGNDSDPMDEDGHGTMVASTIAANKFTYNGVTYGGVAPDAQIVALRVGTEDNIAYSNIEKALQWVIKNYQKYSISVVNLSLGSSSYTDAETDDTLSDEFAMLAKDDVFVVAASGNSNDQNTGPISQDGIAYPAADPNVFAVGAVDSSDVIATWSQRGDELDLLAPGVDIVLPTLTGGYEAVDGTSFASPYVAGAAALIRQAAPWAGAGDVASILMSSGHSNRDGDAETGNTTTLLFSRLDIKAAIDLAYDRTPKYDSLDLGTMFDTALDSNGVLHAAYYDSSTGELKYATRDTDGRWSTPTTVDTKGRVGAYPSIAVDNSGKVGISYYDLDNTALKYASFNGVKWTAGTVDSAKLVGTYTSLGFDIDGNAYIAYYKRSTGELKLATLARDAGTWMREVVDATSKNVGLFASIDVAEAAFRTNGFFTTYETTVAIGYADATNGDVKYARRLVDEPESTSPWYISTADNLSGVAHIDVNLHAGPSASGVQAQLAYQDTKNKNVKYAYLISNAGSGTWGTETVASSGNVGASVQLSFDSNDDPTVTYFNGTKRTIYTATRSSTGNWSTDKVATSSGYLSVSYNERTGDAFVTLLNRTKKSVFSDLLV